MKTNLLFFSLIATFSFVETSGQQPFVAANITPGNLNIRSAQPCTTATVAAQLATNSMLVASSTVMSSCGYGWYEVDIPLTSAPTISYYGASGSGYLVSTSYNYVEVTSNVPNGLRIRETTGGTLLWIGNNHAAMWWISSASRGQRLAWTGSAPQYLNGDRWFEVYLPYNYCTVGQGGPYTQTGWVCEGATQPDGPYLTYLPVMLSQDIVQNNLSIFPNPSSGKFSVVSNNTGSLNLNVMNSIGETIYEANLVNQTTEIDLGGNAPGIYFCRFISEGTIVETRRIIIE